MQIVDLIQLGLQIYKHFIYENIIMIYISTCHDPFINLAIEDWLLNQKKSNQTLFLWQNFPCIVIGRAQNPWIECNLKEMQRNNIPLVRRQSGGGAVYHDLGNLNITIFSAIKEHSIIKNLDFISKIINTLGIKLISNERNDLIVHYNSNNYKVSGSAFRHVKDYAFQHLTLLVNCNLKNLKKYLKPFNKGIISKGIKSIISPVINLNQIEPNLNISKIQDALISFAKLDSKKKIIKISAKKYKINKKKFATWEWCFGKTPPFVQKIKNFDAKKIVIYVEKGIITDIKSNEISEKHLNKIKYKFLCKRYCIKNIKNIKNY